jgi:oligopeptide transport system substrate-binding protein
VLRDLPIAPLWSAHGHAAWGTRVSGVRTDPYRDIELEQVEVRG